jgi:hypothetical protein
MSETAVRNLDIPLIEDNEGDVLLTSTAFAEGKARHRLHVCRTGEEGLAFLRREEEFRGPIW